MQEQVGELVEVARVDGPAVDRTPVGGCREQVEEEVDPVDEAIRHGSEDRTTDTVRRVTGRPPRSVADFLRAHVADLAGPPGPSRLRQNR